MTPDNVNVEVELARHDLRIGAVEKTLETIRQLEKTVGDLREEVGTLKTQHKITWALLLPIILGMIGIAIETFKGGGIP